MSDCVIVNEGNKEALAGCTEDSFLDSGFDFEYFFRSGWFESQRFYFWEIIFATVEDFVQEAHRIVGVFGGDKEAVFGEEDNRGFSAVTLLIGGYEA